MAEEEEPIEGTSLGLTLEVAVRVSITWLTLKPLYLFERLLRRTSTVEMGAGARARRPRVTTEGPKYHWDYTINT